MAKEELVHKSAGALLALVKSRAISPVEILEANLAVIERLNPRLNAIVTLAADEAMAGARAAEQAVIRGEALGALHGLPIGIKDITCTAGIRTTFGSPVYKDFVPNEDAEVVRRLKAANAIVLAKTNTPEFAAGANTVNPVFGATRNPWNPALSPAGSSGGSAVAVASGMLPLAHGTDFGCSVRMPAAFCGIVGIRPTPGLIPNHPMPLAWDPGQVHGALARSAEDVARMLDAMVGFSRKSPISVVPPWESALAEVEACSDARGTRVAYVSDIAGIGVDSEIDTICRKAANSLRDAGASVEEIAFDASEGCGPYQVWRGLWMVGQQLSNLDKLDQLGANLAGNVEAGLKVTALDVAKAERMRQSLFLRFYDLFEQFDFLLTPASPVKQYPVEENFPSVVNGRKLKNYTDWIAGSFLITLMSLPAASVPAGKTKNGLPVGLQVVGARFEEPRILALAKIIQALQPVGWPPNSA